MRARAPIVVAALAAILGFAFAATSTNDFVQHLDRQVHGLHCSFLPGLGDTDVSGESGCHVTLMSPYSSFAREAVWGGVPISLPAMAVFAFLVALAVGTLLLGKEGDRRVAGFAALAWGVPVIASAAMGYIAFSTLDAACKLCIGIYASSGVGMIAALAALFLAPRAAPVVARVEVDARTADTLVDAEPPPRAPPAPSGGPPTSWAALAGAFAVGVLFVGVPVAVYAAAAPDFSSYTGTCGQLLDRSDPHDVLLPIGTQLNPVPVVEILDPLCPACRGFEGRLEASSVPAQASRRVLLFPLDNTCNWMLDRAIHPGACAISEAVLCADDEAEAVIDWAFENQSAILEAAREDPEAAARIARERFPSLRDCIGSPEVQARLNQSLRWAVKNQLPILTPQVYVGSTRLCDADTDLGMDYALTRLVERYRTTPEPEPPATQEAAIEAPSRSAVARPAPPSEPRPAAAAPRGPTITPGPGTVFIEPEEEAPTTAPEPAPAPTSEPAEAPEPAEASPAPPPPPVVAAPAPSPSAARPPAGSVDEEDEEMVE